MDVKELRVGNYVVAGNNGTLYKDGAIGKVLSIGSEEQKFEQIYCECDESFEWFFKDNYFGIPLNEEWIVKLGFTYVEYMDRFEILGYFRVSFSDRGDLRINIGGECFDVHCKYVHSFQNLFYALEQKELTLKD